MILLKIQDLIIPYHSIRVYVLGSTKHIKSSSSLQFQTKECHIQVLIFLLNPGLFYVQMALICTSVDNSLLKQNSNGLEFAAWKREKSKIFKCSFCEVNNSKIRKVCSTEVNKCESLTECIQ